MLQYKVHIDSIVSGILQDATPKVGFFTGATASGKTALAHAVYEELTQRKLKVVIVNTDASQVYANVNIGTAKPNAEDLRYYNYQNIDLCKTNERIDAHDFATKTIALIQEKMSENKIVLCVGGSGLYLNSILSPLTLSISRNDTLRQYFRGYADCFGWKSLHQVLHKAWPERARQLHANDKTRIERALEIWFLENEKEKRQEDFFETKFEVHSQNKHHIFESFVVVVEKQKENLRSLIFQRVEAMFEAGWLEEVEQLKRAHGESCAAFQSFQAIGYKNVLEFLASKSSEALSQNSSWNLEENLNLLKQKIFHLTWQYARRQLTWNKKLKPNLLVRID